MMHTFPEPANKALVMYSIPKLRWLFENKNNYLLNPSNSLNQHICPLQSLSADFHSSKNFQAQLILIK